MPLRQRFLWRFWWTFLCPLVVGCALFIPQSPPGSEARTSGKPLLPSLIPPKDAIQLEMVFVERSPDDPLMGDLLWHEVDQLGAANPDLHAMLNLNGLRVGHVSSTPPQALQTLLGITTELNPVDSSKKLVGKRMLVTSGSPAEIQMGIHRETLELELHQGSQLLKKNYANSVCVFKITPHRLQEGWVRLDFVPEIHHGEARPRHVPTENGWETRGGQRIDARNAEKFSMVLNMGEMAVLALEPDRPATLGEAFFLGQDENESPLQRMLVIRLRDMTRMTRVYQE